MLTKILVGPYFVVATGLAFWGFLLVLQYLHLQLGDMGFAMAVFGFPIPYVFMPLWIGFHDGEWLPLVACYTPVIMLFAFQGFSNATAHR